ncbi:MAG TPA: N-acetylmuramoyl-L-alanine amidase [Acidobacteriaceae bacterium]
MFAGLLLLVCAGAAGARGQRNAYAAASPGSSYDQAVRMRGELEGRPQAQRTRREYDRVLGAFRGVYHGSPRDPHADAAAMAVAELLAAEGRLFDDRRSLEDAVSQYEFLRRAYPASRYRYGALMTEGEIYDHDLGDRTAARTIFTLFLNEYPGNALADEARQELSRMRGAERAGAGARGGHHSNAVLQAAIASRSAQPPARARAAGGQGRGMAGMASTVPQAPAVSQASATQMAATPPKQARLPAPAARGEEPVPAPSLNEAALNAAPPPRHGRLPLVTGVRQWSTPVYTRVAIDLDEEVRYEASRVPNPDRIFFDLHGARLSPELSGKAVTVTDGGFLKRIRTAQAGEDVVRVVMDVSDVSEYSAFFLPNPSRLIIDIHGRAAGGGAPVYTASREPGRAVTGVRGASGSAGALGDIATLDRQPNAVRATRVPTTAPVSASVADTRPAAQSGSSAAAASSRRAGIAAGSLAARASNPPSQMPTNTPSQTAMSAGSNAGIRAAEPTASGERSMVRALGLKIGRIVVDAGHGGHDSGTLGPGGIEEKDVVLDVALRLGRLLKQRLGADVIYTRDDDTFIPLETRTAIANKAQADLFISVHANSSQDAGARGVETYYLNFTSSADALEVAARENAVSQQSIHQLSDLVKKITLQDKIAESREFAGDVEQSLYTGLETGNPGLRDRGVKKAPFVVLIGANMPSILAEISFLTNPDDAHQLRDGEYRQRIAESLYRGVAKYVGSLSGVRLAESGSRPAGQ